MISGCCQSESILSHLIAFTMEKTCCTLFAVAYCYMVNWFSTKIFVKVPNAIFLVSEKEARFDHSSSIWYVY